MQPERIPVRNSRRTIFRLREPGPLTNLSALADESPEGVQLRPSGDCNTHKKLSKLTCCNRCCIVAGRHPPDRPQPPGLAPEEDEFRPAFQLLSACPGGNPGYAAIGRFTFTGGNTASNPVRFPSLTLPRKAASTKALQHTWRALSCTPNRGQKLPCTCRRVSHPRPPVRPLRSVMNYSESDISGLGPALVQGICVPLDSRTSPSTSTIWLRLCRITRSLPRLVFPKQKMSGGAGFTRLGIESASQTNSKRGRIT
jgi:hypothetical protein